MLLFHSSFDKYTTAVTFVTLYCYSWSAYGGGSTYYDGSSNLCGGGQGGGDESWYVGGTPCFRANAAYSIYGVLYNGTTSDIQNEQRSRRRNAPYMCNKGTYINTFYTTAGATSLSSALGITDETGMATETCTVSYRSNSNNNNGNNNKDQKNDNHDNKDNKNNNNNKISATMSCNATGHFEYDLFLGGLCDGSKYNSTEDSLEAYNEAMQAIDCDQVWDYDLYLGSSGSSNNNNRRLGYGSPAETILKYSATCGNYYYSGSPVCPGPIDEPKQRMTRAGKAVTRFSWFCMVWGGVLLYLAYLVHMKKRRAKEMGVDCSDPIYSKEVPQHVTVFEQISATASNLSQGIARAASNVSGRISRNLPDGIATSESNISVRMSRTKSEITSGNVFVSSSKSGIEEDNTPSGVLI